MCHGKYCLEYVFLRLRQFTNSHTKDTSDSCYSLRKIRDYWRECPISEEKEMMANEADETPEDIVEHLAELGLNPQDDDLSDMLDDAPTTPRNMYGDEL